MVGPKAKDIREYHVFLASPGDMNAERQAVRDFFDEFNRTIAKPQWNVQFTVIDWENYAMAGVGRPQELVTKDTLEKYRDSLALVIGLMGQRFGTRTGKKGSGTEEEFEWALAENQKNGFPEIKWFLREVTKFEAPSDPDQIVEATEQWKKVLAFRKRLQKKGKHQCYYKEFKSRREFETLLRNDLQPWLGDKYGSSNQASVAAAPPIVPRPPGPQVPLPPTGSALHQLPPPPRDFVGREEEKKELLGEIEKGGVHISGAFGMGGIGKTALALVIADRLKPKYPDAQFYLDLRGAPNPQQMDQKPVTPEEALAHVIRGFHPEAKLPEKLHELQAVYRSLLDGKRAILLMDNARDADQVAPLDPPNGCVLLVTSRNHFHLPGLYSKDLEKLPIEDAKKLLLSISKRIGDQAGEIARICDYLPLAMRVAAGALVERADLAAEGLVRRLSDEKKKGKALEKAYDIAFRTSEALLDDDLRNKWHRLSVFPVDFAALAAHVVWEEKDGDATQEALGDLVRRSMVEFIPSTHRFKLHDLAREYAAGRLDTQATMDAKLAHARHFLQFLWMYDTVYVTGGSNVGESLALFDLEFVNIRAGFAWANQHAGSDYRVATLCNDYGRTGVYVLTLRMHARERIDWFKAALKAARSLKDRAAEASHLGNLGIAYRNLSDARKAIEYHEYHLAVAREIAHRQGEGNALGNLGAAYYELGDAIKAIEYCEQHRVIAREIGDRRGEGNALGNLGNAYRDLGDARKAIEYYERRLVIAREIGDRRGEGNALGNLGVAYADLGDFPKAIEYCERRLVIAREIGDRLGEGSALGNLGVNYKDLGDARKAIEYYEQQLVITRDIGDRRGEGNALGNLGIAYKNLGDLPKAIEYYEKQLVIAREIGDRRGEGHAVGNLGIAHADLGDLPKAIGYLEKDFVIAREIGDRAGEATASWNLGCLYRDQGDLKRAVELMQACVDFEREIDHAQAEQSAAIVDDLRRQLP